MNLFGDLLNNIEGTFFTNILRNLRTPALSLLGVLAIIDLVLTTLKHLGDPDTFKKLSFSILKYTIILWLLTGGTFQELTGTFFKGCIYVGGIGSNMPTDIGTVNKIPDQIIKRGLDLWGNLTARGMTPDIGLSWNIPKMIKNAAIEIATFPVKLVVTLFLGILVMICFGLLAIELFVTIAEFYICAGVALIFIPFAANRHTAFLAHKVMNALIGFGVKVIFVVLVVNVGMDSFKNMNSGVSWEYLFKALFTVLGLLILTWKVPKIAMGFMNGTPSQGGMAMVAGAASKAAMAAGGMFQAAKIGMAAAGAGKAGAAGAGATGAAGKIGTTSGAGAQGATGSASGGDSLVNGSTLGGNSGGGATKAPSGGNDSAPVAAPKSRLAGAVQGMAKYALMSTSFGAGMDDAKTKLNGNSGSDLKSRLASGNSNAEVAASTAWTGPVSLDDDEPAYKLNNNDNLHKRDNQ